MDFGDAFYGAVLGASMIYVTGAELFAMFILACGFCTGHGPGFGWPSSQGC